MAKAPLERVIAQIQFPVILKIEDKSAVSIFQEAIRRDYPILRELQSQTVQIQMGPNAPFALPSVSRIWQFSDAAGAWKVALARDVLTIDTASYRSRADLIARWGMAINALKESFGPDLVDRIGMRYIDRITGIQFKNFESLLNPKLLGSTVAALKSHLKYSLSEATFEVDEGEMLLRWGVMPPQMSPDASAILPLQQESFVLDIDVWSTQQRQFDTKALSLAFQKLAERAYTVFRFAVTDKFLQAYESDSCSSVALNSLELSLPAGALQCAFEFRGVGTTAVSAVELCVPISTQRVATEASGLVQTLQISQAVNWMYVWARAAQENTMLHFVVLDSALTTFSVRKFGSCNVSFGQATRGPVEHLVEVAGWCEWGALALPFANKTDPTPSSHAARALARIRHASDLTIEAIAPLVGVSRRTVHNWFAGGNISQRNEERLRALAEAVEQIAAVEPATARERLMDRILGSPRLYDLLAEVDTKPQSHARRVSSQLRVHWSTRRRANYRRRFPHASPH